MWGSDDFDGLDARGFVLILIRSILGVGPDVFEGLETRDFVIILFRSMLGGSDVFDDLKG